MTRQTPFADPAVARVFAGYPASPRRALLALRELIFETARHTEGVGAIEETLKWGEPAYLTARSGSGTTIRIAWKPRAPDRYALYVHCQTDLIETFRTLFPEEFEFEKNRAMVMRVADDPSPAALAHCIGAALTYHLRKRSPAGTPVQGGRK